MCVISINLSNLDSYWNPIVGKATKAVSEINEATNRLSKVKSDLNVEIRQRRDIAGRLYSISNSLIDIEYDIREVENFLRNSLQRYHNADQTIKQLTANYGLEKESIGDKLKRVFLEWDELAKSEIR